MSVTFNIIYVGGTVEFLLPFAFTLLEHSSCRFRLVANGCSAAEESRLERVCQKHERLEFYSLSSPEPLVHGQVLSHLQRLERSPYFAFMDSDIFATGPWIDAHLHRLRDRTAIFSCLPVWQDPGELIMPAGYRFMRGGFLETHDGQLLGVSYYAIYRNDPLRDFIRTSGIDFQKYFWRDVPNGYRTVLENRGLKVETYDTCKLLNILFQHEGALMAFEPTEHLTHIGASTAVPERKALRYALRRRLVSVLPPHVLDLWRAVRRGGPLGLQSAEERKELDRIGQTRRASQLYLTHVMNGHHDSAGGEQYLTALPENVQERIRAIGAQVLEIHRAFRADGR